MFASRCCNLKACSNEANIMQHCWANTQFGTLFICHEIENFVEINAAVSRDRRRGKNREENRGGDMNLGEDSRIKQMVHRLKIKR